MVKTNVIYSGVSVHNKEALFNVRVIRLIFPSITVLLEQCWSENHGSCKAVYYTVCKASDRSFLK